MTSIKLNDLQLVLLSSAAQREDGSLLPPPEHIRDQTARIRKVIPPLIKRGLVEEAPTSDATKVWREEAGQRFALIITEAGRIAIGVSELSEGTTETPVLPASQPVGKASKSELVLTMLRREEGASLDEIVATTGWLAHSTRAALTGLRKKGHTIDKRRVTDETRYFLAAAAAA